MKKLSTPFGPFQKIGQLTRITSYKAAGIPRKKCTTFGRLNFHLCCTCRLQDSSGGRHVTRIMIIMIMTIIEKLGCRALKFSLF